MDQQEELEVAGMLATTTATALLTVATLGLAVLSWLWWQAPGRQRPDGQGGLTLDAVPDEVLLHVMSFLDHGRDLASASAVSSRWSQVARDQGLWARLVRRELASSPLWAEASGGQHRRGALTSASLKRWSTRHEFPDHLRELVRRVCDRASREGVIDWRTIYAIEARLTGGGQGQQTPSSSSPWQWVKQKVMNMVFSAPHLVFMGLDNVGKTTMIHILTSDRLVIHPPSNYPYQEEVTIAGQRYMLLDPAAPWRKGVSWRNQPFPEGSGVVYIVDACDSQRLDEARSDLAQVMKRAQKNRVPRPVLVLGNKIDRRDAISEAQLKTALGLHYFCTGKELRPLKEGVQPVEVFMASVVKRCGFSEGLRWLTFHRR